MERIPVTFLKSACFIVVALGCQAPSKVPIRRAADVGVPREVQSDGQIVHRVSYENLEPSASDHEPTEVMAAPVESNSPTALPDLLSHVDDNLKLQMIGRRFQAARAKSRYVDELPDPTLGSSLFIVPIETAAGSQRANMTASQMLPWLSRLDAQAKQACLEAAAISQEYQAERLRIVAEVRRHWYRMYALQMAIDLHTANQQLLESIIAVANSRVSTGRAAQSDVLAGTLEYSKAEERLVELRRQLVASKTATNRLLGRSPDTPIVAPRSIQVTLPDWNHADLVEQALQSQPEIEAARIHQQAARWGVKIARLKRRPDFSVNASWFAMDDNRPASSIIDIGGDAWSLGATVTIPLRDEKYDAIEQEALWKHDTKRITVEDLEQRYSTVLFDLWEEARAADETTRLYTDTIIPQAKQTLRSDQEAYANGTVEFDRLIEDLRNLLTLELGYHKAKGRLATTMAMMEASTGVTLANNLP